MASSKRGSKVSVTPGLSGRCHDKPRKMIDDEGFSLQGGRMRAASDPERI